VISASAGAKRRMREAAANHREDPS